MASEFGKGFVYNIGLFLAHEHIISIEMILDMAKKLNRDPDYSLIFYGASDHLIGLQIPPAIPEELEIKIKEFREFVLNRRFGHVSEKEYREAFNTAREILLDYDLYLGTDAEKGDYE